MGSFKWGNLKWGDFIVGGNRGRGDCGVVGFCGAEGPGSFIAGDGKKEGGGFNCSDGFPPSPVEPGSRETETASSDPDGCIAVATLAAYFSQPKDIVPSARIVGPPPSQKRLSSKTDRAYIHLVFRSPLQHKIDNNTGSTSDSPDGTSLFSRPVEDFCRKNDSRRG